MLRLSLLTLSLVLFLAGCASSASPTRTIPTSLSWGLTGMTDLPTLDPALASDPASISVASLVYGGLVRLNSSLRVVPDGASHWTLSPDGKTYTFRLRSNLRFPDGRRVRAADVVAAMQRALGPEGAAGPAPFYLNLIAGNGSERAIRALGPRLVQITLIRPAAQFLAELAFPSSYVPDLSLLSRYGPTWTDHAAGFGPYRVDTWQHGRYLILSPNRYYWGGTPAFRRITIHFYSQTDHALAAYQRGDLSIVSGLEPGTVPAHPPQGLHRRPGLAMDYLAFNARQAPFHHINARRAFTAAISKTTDPAAMGPAAFPSTGFLPPAFGLSAPPWRSTVRPASFLARAHYPGGSGFPHLTLVIPRDARVKALADRLVYDWEARLNVQVGVRELNPTTYSAVLDSHNFQLAIVRWGADYADAQDFLDTQLGSSQDNVTGWTSPAYQRVLNQAASYSPSDVRRSALLRTAATMAARKVVLVPLDEPAVTAVINPALRGVALTSLGTISGDWVHAHLSR